MNIPPGWERLHDQSRRSLVRAERSLAMAMRREVRAIVASVADVADERRAAQRAAVEMLRRLPVVILAGRRAARAGSAKSLDAELRKASRIVPGVPQVTPTVTTREDEVRAIAAARGYAAAWLKAALHAIEEERTRPSD